MALNLKKEFKVSGDDQWLLVRVTDMGTGKPKANVRIPADLANPGMKLAARFTPFSIERLDMKQMIEVLKSGGENMLADIEDMEKGEHIEIFVD
jgi:hypothetical protein